MPAPRWPTAAGLAPAPGRTHVQGVKSPPPPPPPPPRGSRAAPSAREPPSALALARAAAVAANFADRRSAAVLPSSCGDRPRLVRAKDDTDREAALAGDRSGPGPWPGPRLRVAEAAGLLREGREARGSGTTSPAEPLDFAFGYTSQVDPALGASHLLRTSGDSLPPSRRFAFGRGTCIPQPAAAVPLGSPRRRRPRTSVERSAVARLAALSEALANSAEDNLRDTGAGSEVLAGL